jgi:DNA-binding response OmpR family regulator
MRLILVEDNERLAESIRQGLEGEGFVLDHFGSLAQARSALESAHYDLLLLDLGLPDGDGMDLIRLLRRRGIATPVLVITARDALGDRIRGLDSGADDYLVKPFSTLELAARCRALLRRPGGSLGTVLEAGNVALDVATREVRVAGKLIEMPPRETALLEALMRHSGRIVTKSAIDAALYALRAEVTPNAIDAALSRLRRRLAGATANVQVHTAHGIGYTLIAPASAAAAGLD